MQGKIAHTYDPTTAEGIVTTDTTFKSIAAKDRQELLDAETMCNNISQILYRTSQIHVLLSNSLDCIRKAENALKSWYGSMYNVVGYTNWYNNTVRNWSS